MKTFELKLTPEMKQAITDDKEITLAFIDEDGSVRAKLKISTK